jgi:hypothetical protein
MVDLVSAPEAEAVVTNKGLARPTYVKHQMKRPFLLSSVLCLNLAQRKQSIKLMILFIANKAYFIFFIICREKISLL